MAEGFEAPLTQFPWVSREEVAKVRGEIASVMDELRRVREGLKGLEERVSRAESLSKDASALKGEVNAIGNTLNDLRNRVRGLEERVSTLQGKVLKLEGTAELALMVGKWKSETCSKCKAELCTAWRLGKDAAGTLAKRFGQDAVVGGDKDLWRVRVSKVPYLCALCPLYEPRAGGSSE